MQMFASPDPYYHDENKWVTEMYEQLKVDVENSLQPLETFLKCFDAYKDVLKIKPDEYIK